MTTVARDFMTHQYEWFSESVWPPVATLWERLEVPEFGLYQQAVQACARDSWKASQSTYHVLYMTFRPIGILLWIILKFLWRNLLEHGGKSLQRGARQVKVAAIAFYKFQISLTPKEVLGEVGLIGLGVALFYFQRWLRKQTYWSRTVRWCRNKKAKCVQAFTRLVHKVAEVSKVLAMSLPHLVFLGWCAAVRILFPSHVRWLAHDTYFVVTLSVVYPFLSTLMWIHARRYPHLNKAPKKKKGKDEKDEIIRQSQDDTATSSGMLRKRMSPAKIKAKSSATANSNVPAAYDRSNLASTRNGASLTTTSGNTSNHLTPEAAVVYWLRYWQCYAMVQAFGQFCAMVPVFGRIVTRYPLFYLLAGETKLLFFTWLFGMEYMLSNTSKDAFMAQAMPGSLIKRFVTPLLLVLHERISDLVPHDLWDKWVVSNAKNILGGFVFIKIISERTKNWILHVLEESRAVVVPAVTLLMPGFVTSFGVAYVQYIVPSAKSATAKGDANKLVYLQYWVLNCAVAGLLAWFSGILWWIPFSNHCIFILWSYLAFPETIRTYYGKLESELISFGILKGDDVELTVQDTLTASLFRALVSRLPSAAEIDGTESCNGIVSKDSDDSIPELGSKTSDSDHEERDSSNSPRQSTHSSASLLHAKTD